MVKLYLPLASKGRVIDSLSVVVTHTEIKGPRGMALVLLLGGVVGSVVGLPELEQDEVKNQVIAIIVIHSKAIMGEGGDKCYKVFGICTFSFCIHFIIFFILSHNIFLKNLIFTDYRQSMLVKVYHKKRNLSIILFILYPLPNSQPIKHPTKGLSNSFPRVRNYSFWGIEYLKKLAKKPVKQEAR